MLAEAPTKTLQSKRILGSDGTVSFTPASPSPQSQACAQRARSRRDLDLQLLSPALNHPGAQRGLDRQDWNWVTSPFYFQPVPSSPW